VVNLQANFQQETEDEKTDDAGDYTIQFGLSNIHRVPPITSPNLGNITPTAEIVWSVEGNEVRRIISIVNGVTVTGTGQAVKVKVYDATPANDPGQATQYDVSVLIAPGIRPSTQQVPFFAPTIQTGIIGLPVGVALVNPTETVSAHIPVNAGATSVYVSVAGALTPIVLSESDLSVIHVSSTGVPTRMYDPRDAGWVPLSPQTTEIRLFNNLPLGGAVLIFNVAFGIDG
jgi:hypothetical protein